jgi:D-alanyl-lipoteichoic acid acyltransferase DltB (MBOAT superfamily)
MLFNSVLYAVFLLATYAVFWLLRARRLARTLFLVLASYVFYFVGTYDTAVTQPVPLGPIGWSALCLGIIFVGSSLDFAIGRALGRTESPRVRRALLLLSIGYYLGVLAVFKYWNFAVDSFAQLFAWGGLPVTPVHLRLVLPFGISFFTFETMSYTIDVYRRQIPPADRYLDYLLFVCFFPHLVAGPIVRPHQMLPQLARPPVVTQEEQARGLFRIATGLAKKMAMGDVLAVAIVNPVFDNPERYSSLEVAVAVYAYAIQIYADFSGYTDVALGSAALFGYRLPENFDRPYVARSIQDFWHRWHMTLSSWLRDYLYIPLGGNRHGGLFTYRNLMITMLLGGLWHGASWTFVIWGALHGAGLAVTRMVQRRRAARGSDSRSRSPSRSRIADVAGVVLTFHFVCFCWIFFRAPSFEHASLVLARIAKGTTSAGNVSARVVLTIAIALVAQYLPKNAMQRLTDRFAASPSWVQGLVLAGAAYGVHFAASVRSQPFVYGQF